MKRVWPEWAGVDEGSDIRNYLDDIADFAQASNGFVIEIGVWRGTGSTVAFEAGLTGHPDPLFISVDQADYTTYKPSAPFWHFVIGDDRLPSTAEEARKIAGDRKAGIIYIDTNHDYEQMSAELRNWSSFADDQTMWLFHDTWLFGSFNEPMVRAIREFGAVTGLCYEDLKTDKHGLGRLRKL